MLGAQGTVFPDEYLALGGDEVGYACAAGVPAIEAFVAAHNMTAPDLLRSARPLVNAI